MFGPICSNCGAHGHTLMRCTDLIDPLKPGFHSGGNGGGGHGGDDEDEHYTLPRKERFLETTVTFFGSSSTAVRSENSLISLIQETLPEASVFRFVV